MRRLAAVLAAAAFAPAAGAAYKCVDAKGFTHIGDTPPDACATVVMYEVRPNGTVIRKIDPTPTPEQAKAMREEEERQKEERRAAAEQKRKDMALLSSFGSEKEFDVVRDRNIEPLAGRIRNNQDRIKAIDKRMKEIEDEMEFYKAGKSKAAAGKGREMPSALVEGLNGGRNEKATLEKANVQIAKEIEELKAKSEADKKRWVALKNTPATLPPASASNEPKKR